MFYKDIWTKIPNSVGFYLFLTAWMLSCLVISSAYSGLLSSIMTIPNMTPIIKSFNDLAKAQKEGKISVFGHIHSLNYKMIRVE